MGLLLTDAERERFASYLEQDIRTEQALVEQMAKLSVSEPWIKVTKMRIAAKTIVAQLLRTTESQTIDAIDRNTGSQ